MAFLSVTSMYLYKFVIPAIDISEATSEKLKLLQNIFLGSFASSLQWAGLNCSRFPILINLLCLLGTKMTFIWKQHFFRFSTVQYLGYFCTFFAFLPAFCGWRLFYQPSVGTWTSLNLACTKSFCKSKFVSLHTFCNSCSGIISVLRKRNNATLLPGCGICH